MAQVLCPKCGSDQITANKKGFSGTKALAGAALTGGIGLLAGTAGSNKINITCLSCGKEFKPGQGATRKSSRRTNNDTNQNSTAGAIMVAIIIFIIWYLFF
jgi:predicted RNA-binding Zn-ribbon protein involved in translation (DUF1610 family)